MEKTSLSSSSVDLRLSQHANHVRQLSLVISRGSGTENSGTPPFLQESSEIVELNDEDEF